MDENKPFRFKFDSIEYRKGFIEITPNIHPMCVNVELWQIHPDTDISVVNWISDESISDSSVISNVELELDVEQATELAQALLSSCKSMSDDK